MKNNETNNIKTDTFSFNMSSFLTKPVASSFMLVVLVVSATYMGLIFGYLQFRISWLTRKLLFFSIAVKVRQSNCVISFGI